MYNQYKFHQRNTSLQQRNTFGYNEKRQILKNKPSGKLRAKSYIEVLIINSKFQVPNSKFQVPNSKFQVSNPKFQVPSSNLPRRTNSKLQTLHCKVPELRYTELDEVSKVRTPNTLGTVRLRSPHRSRHFLHFPLKTVFLIFDSYPDFCKFITYKIRCSIIFICFCLHSKIKNHINNFFKHVVITCLLILIF